MLTGFDLCRAAMAVQDITAPEQSVLLVLAVMADEDARCYPGINGPKGLTGKTKLSERSVQRSVQALKEAGHIDWIDSPGKGRTYIVHPRHSGAPDSVTPVTETPVTETPPPHSRDTPATVAPKQPVSTNTSQKTSSSSRTRASRGTPVPTNFTPHPARDSITEKAMAAWPPGVLEEQIEHFIDYHTLHGTLSKDWQISWRTWVKNWKNFNGDRTARRMDGQPDLRGSRPDPALDLRNAARRAAQTQYPADSGGDYWQSRSALPAIWNG